MKASFCTYVLGNTQEEMTHAIPRLASMGYDGLEFWEQYLSTADLGWLKETMDEHAPYIRTYTGSVGSDDATPEQWESCIRGLREICRLGEPHGIVFPLETHQVIHNGPNLTDRSATTLRLLDEVGMPNLKVNLQTPLLDEPVKYPAEQLGDQIVHLHAHNWTGSWRNLTFLDSGDEDFAGFMWALKRKGLDGYISIEHGNHHPPYEVAKHEAKYLKRLISGEFWPKAQ